jgi:hypothetical protein
MFKYTLEGLCSSLEVHSINNPLDPNLVRLKLTPTSEGIFTRDELHAMIRLLDAVLKDETP